MNNSSFMSALELSFEEQCSDITKTSIPTYEVSVRFKKKMEKLIKQQRKPYFKMVCTAGRRAACIVVALIVLFFSSLSVKAAREAVHDFFMSIFSDHTVVTANTNVSENYPETIEEEYVITDLPEGFELEKYVKNDNRVISRYFYEDKYITFEQRVKKLYNNNLDNEQTETYYYMDKTGQEILLHKSDYDYILMWDNGEYIFRICSNLDKNVLLDLCSCTNLKK